MFVLVYQLWGPASVLAITTLEWRCWRMNKLKGEENWDQVKPHLLVERSNHFLKIAHLWIQWECYCQQKSICLATFLASLLCAFPILGGGITYSWFSLLTLYVFISRFDLAPHMWSFSSFSHSLPLSISCFVPSNGG